MAREPIRPREPGGNNSALTKAMNQLIRKLDALPREIKAQLQSLTTQAGRRGEFEQARSAAEAVSGKGGGGGGAGGIGGGLGLAGSLIAADIGGRVATGAQAAITDALDPMKTEAQKRAGREVAAGGAAGAVGGAATGALAGAAIGSAVPVVGTAVGAVVGAGAGLIGGGALGSGLATSENADSVAVSGETVSRAGALRDYVSRGGEVTDEVLRESIKHFAEQSARGHAFDKRVVQETTNLEDQIGGNLSKINDPGRPLTDDEAKAVFKEFLQELRALRQDVASRRASGSEASNPFG